MTDDKITFLHFIPGIPTYMLFLLSIHPSIPRRFLCTLSIMARRMLSFLDRWPWWCAHIGRREERIKKGVEASVFSKTCSFQTTSCLCTLAPRASLRHLLHDVTLMAIGVSTDVLTRLLCNESFCWMVSWWIS